MFDECHCGLQAWKKSGDRSELMNDGGLMISLWIITIQDLGWSKRSPPNGLVNGWLFTRDRMKIVLRKMFLQRKWWCMTNHHGNILWDIYIYCIYIYRLVFWNMSYFPYIWKNNPNWRTHIFKRGFSTTNQIYCNQPWWLVLKWFSWQRGWLHLDLCIFFGQPARWTSRNSRIFDASTRSNPHNRKKRGEVKGKKILPWVQWGFGSSSSSKGAHDNGWSVDWWWIKTSQCQMVMGLNFGTFGIPWYSEIAGEWMLVPPSW